MPTYAPAHHRLLTRAQTDKFISALTHAKDAGDTEKAVEQAINDLLVAGLTKAPPMPPWPTTTATTPTATLLCLLLPAWPGPTRC